MNARPVTCPDCGHDFPAKLADKWGPDLNGLIVCDGCRERTWRTELKRKANR